MIIEFKGGPCDGELLGYPGDPTDAYFFVSRKHPGHPVYRTTCCPCCAAEAEIVDYEFIGYEAELRMAQSLAAVVTENDSKLAEGSD